VTTDEQSRTSLLQIFLLFTAAHLAWQYITNTYSTHQHVFYILYNITNSSQVTQRCFEQLNM